MGCFESKPVVHDPDTLSKVPIVESPASQAAAAGAAVRAASETVVDVPRPKTEVTDATRAELKVKTQRDRLDAFMKDAENVLRQDALLASRARRAGNMATCRVLLHKRHLLQEKIGRREAAYATVLQMIAAMDSAADNTKLVESIESGTRAINEAMKDVTMERVETALEGSAEAVAYTKRMGDVLGGAEDMSDAEFEAGMAELDALEAETAAQHGASIGIDAEKMGGALEGGAAEQAAYDTTASLPDVPSMVPPPPTGPLVATVGTHGDNAEVRKMELA